MSGYERNVEVEGIHEEEDVAYDSDSTFTSCLEVPTEDWFTYERDSAEEIDIQRGNDDIEDQESSESDEDEDEIDGWCGVGHHTPLTGSGCIEQSIGSQKLDMLQLMNKDTPDPAREMIDRQLSFTTKMLAIKDFRDNQMSALNYTDQDRKELFPELDVIIGCHKQIEEGLKQALMSNPSNPRVGPVYKQILPFLMSHDGMLSKALSSRQTIKGLAEKDNKFKGKLEGFLTKKPRISLEDYYQEPFKYLVDMREIFKRLMRRVEGNSQDQKLNEGVLQEFENVILKIDSLENDRRHLYLKAEFMKYGLQMPQGPRNLLHECAWARQLVTRIGKPFQVEAFLFSDAIVLCNPSLQMAKPGSLSLLSLKECFVVEEMIFGEATKRGETRKKLVIYTIESVVELIIGGLTDHRAWLEEFTKVGVMSTVEESEKMKNDGSRAPRMLGKTKGGSCAGATCQKQLETKTPVQQCNCCGKVFCKGCCFNEATLKYCREKGKRKVCHGCLWTLTMPQS